MTLVSEIITDAYRESNLIPIVSSPTTNQTAEALRRFNPLLLSTIGNEVGEDFSDLNIGGTFDQSNWIATWVPDDTRLILNLTGDVTYELDPYPKEGQRLAIVDTAGNLATNTLTFSGNGRLIENAASLVLNTNSLTRQWMYRGDLGNWVRISQLVAGDTVPFPIEFDDYFVTMLAIRLNPRYGQELPHETQIMLQRYRSQIRARYNKPREIESDLNPRNMLQDTTIYSLDSEISFNRGKIQW